MGHITSKVLRKLGLTPINFTIELYPINHQERLEKFLIIATSGNITIISPPDFQNNSSLLSLESAMKKKVQTVKSHPTVISLTIEVLEYLETQLGVKFISPSVPQCHGDSTSHFIKVMNVVKKMNFCREFGNPKLDGFCADFLLPGEILIEILSTLSNQTFSSADLFRASLVCKNWWEIINTFVWEKKVLTLGCEKDLKKLNPNWAFVFWQLKKIEENKVSRARLLAMFNHLFDAGM